jgi:hypothetical protein
MGVVEPLTSDQDAGQENRYGCRIQRDASPARGEEPAQCGLVPPDPPARLTVPNVRTKTNETSCCS